MEDEEWEQKGFMARGDALVSIIEKDIVNPQVYFWALVPLCNISGEMVSEVQKTMMSLRHQHAL